MAVSLLFLVLTTLIGIFASSRLKLLRGVAERLGAGMTIALMIQLWLPFLVAQSFGIEGGAALSLVLVFVGALLIFIKNRRRLASFDWRKGLSRLKSRSYGVHGLFLLLLTTFVGYLFYTHSLLPTEQGLSSAGISWEDQSGHAMFASSFLYSENLKFLEYPTYSGWPLGYPFLTDLLAAVLIQLGATLGEGFWLSATYAAAAFLLVAWVLVRNWFKSERAASVAMILLLCAGGFGFVSFLAEIVIGTPWQEALMKHDYVNGWELNLHYHNVLTGILLPMRTSLFGMAVAFSVILLMGRAMEEGVERGRFEILTAAILTGLLPLVNAHSFLAANWCGLAYALLFGRFLDWKRWLTLALWYALPMLVLALPQLLWTRSQMVISETPFIRLHLGWMYDFGEPMSWIDYWLINGGLRVPLAIGCWLFASVRVKKLTSPLFSFLVIGNLMAFQPFVYDNVKLFTFADLAISALIAALLFQLWQRSRAWIFVILPVSGLVVFSGLLSIWREMKLESLIVTKEGVAFADVVRKETPPRSVFLTAEQLNHPVPVLVGRPMVLGYKGWLVQHGIPIAEREADVKTMYEGGEGAAGLLRKYKVDFVVVGPAEREEFKGLNEAFFEQRRSARIRVGGYTLYDIRNWRNLDTELLLPE